MGGQPLLGVDRHPCRGHLRVVGAADDAVGKLDDLVGQGFGAEPPGDLVNLGEGGDLGAMAGRP